MTRNLNTILHSQSILWNRFSISFAMDELNTVGQASTVHYCLPSTNDIITNQTSISERPLESPSPSMSELFSNAVQKFEIPAHLNCIPTCCLLTTTTRILESITSMEAVLQRKVTILHENKDLLPTVGVLIASQPEQGVMDRTLVLQYETIKGEWEGTRAEMRDGGLARSKENVTKLVGLARQWVEEVERRLGVGRGEIDGEAERRIGEWIEKWKDGKKRKETEQWGRSQIQPAAEATVVEGISWLRRDFAFAG